MTREDIISSQALPNIILQLIGSNIKFKDTFKSAAPSIAADIESASSNPNCTCRTKVGTYVTSNSEEIGSLLYQFAYNNNIIADIKSLFDIATSPPISISGKVAKTSITEWPNFTRDIKEKNLNFTHMSTSVVGDDIYVFFL